MTHEPRLTAAALIQHIVCDLLHQNKFPYAHFPELVDLAVVMTGLGMLRSQFEFVKRADMFWDPTYWGVFPRPFLDSQALGYAHAMAAWIRDNQTPDWFADLPATVKGPSKKSLKFLLKTSDAFFTPQSNGKNVLDQDQSQWLKLADVKSVSQQIIAIRHFTPDATVAQPQSKSLLAKLRSANTPLMLHAITAIESLTLNGDDLVDELSHLVQHPDDVVRAKSMIALTKLNRLENTSISAAAKMINSTAKHEVFAGVFALSSQPKIDDAILRSVDRGFLSALQTCDYEFINLYATAYDRWLEQPQSHLEQLLGGDDDYLEIAVEALEASRETSVALG